MMPLAPLDRLNRLADSVLALGAAPLLLATRWYVSWQFLKSGWLKLTNWEQTIGLFTDEYRGPVLPPLAAAVTGTAGELFFPVLLVLGLGGRLGAAGLFAVNAMAVVSYAHVLLAEGFEAALAQHVLWGYMLAVVAVFGPGRFSLDEWFAQRRTVAMPARIAA